MNHVEYAYTDVYTNRKNHFINALLNHNNPVILSDTFHAISGAAQSDSDSDHHEFFVTDRSKKRDILSPRIGVTDDNECSQFDEDAPFIMLGRPLDHHIRARDLSYGPCLATMRATICKYAAKLLALRMMVVIGLWMCHGEERRHYKQPKESFE